MTNEKLYEVLGGINENYIKEAKQVEKPKKSRLIKWVTIAACFAVVAILGVGIF